MCIPKLMGLTQNSFTLCVCRFYVPSLRFPLLLCIMTQKRIIKVMKVRKVTFVFKIECSYYYLCCLSSSGNVPKTQTTKVLANTVLGKCCTVKHLIFQIFFFFSSLSFSAPFPLSDTIFALRKIRKP
uniref:Uncharacterized protein n=1 Tax=Strigamia maritima TaxID=126957 RepID=T1JAU8_STRMM